MDDSKSDNTDDLLTSIEPLIQQSEFLVQEEKNTNNKWLPNRTATGCNFNMAVIVDDILSSRSVGVEEWRERSKFQSPSIANIASHNYRHDEDRLNSDRTVSSHFYEASVSMQTTPRNMSVNRQTINVADDYGMTQQWPRNKESPDHPIIRRETQLQGDLDDARSAFTQSRTEVQRLQLTNKQLSTQLHEAKLSIQTLSIQLEQVQQESKQKENTLANLDNSLGKLVSGWKKRESHKDQDIDSMKQHIDAKEKVIEECQRMADESRRALANADKAVQMEKNRMEQLQKTASVEIQNLKTERAGALKVNQELLTRCGSLETEIKRLHDQYADRIKAAENLNYKINEDNMSWQRENENLKKDIDKMKEEWQNLQFDLQCRDDKLCQMKTEMKMLEDEVHRIRRERDDKNTCVNDLRGNLKKIQEEHSLTLKRQEKELQSQWHQDLNKKLQDLQDQHKRIIQTLTINFQGKLNEQSKRQRAELERLRHVAEQEISSRMADGEETVTMLRERLERSEKSVQFWQQEKEAVEKARNQISAQLYDLMNSGYRQDCGQIANSNTNGDLVKPTFVPTKNQNLLQTMPNSFFTPIKSDSITSLLTPSNVSSTKNGHGLSNRNDALLSSSSGSLYY